MKKSIILPTLFMLICGIAAGQTKVEETKLAQAESLRKEYRFNQAIEIYKGILSQTSDSVLRTEITRLIAKSENGLNMLQYATRPTVTGSKTLSVKDFFLYYPGVPDSVWHLVPPSLSNSNNGYIFPNPLMLNGTEEVIYFSARSKKGDWDIYKITRIDGLNWSSPQPLSSNINSAGDELFPVVVNGGKQLFFSSTGHFGAGGFDLYVSNWNEREQDWDTPQNLGFPYSSVHDDLLLIHSNDGLNTYFASNRNNSSRDSITLYRLDYENMPVRRPVSSIEEAGEIASLKMVSSHDTSSGRDTTREIMTSPDTEEYIKMIMEVRKIQRDIDSITRDIAQNRNLYSTLTNADDRVLLERKITNGELALIATQSRLRDANLVVQRRELEFLSKGTLLPRSEDFFREERPPVVKEVALNLFNPQRGALMHFPVINIIEPVKLFDYTFSVAEHSEMAEDHSFPDGLVYRIQLFAVSAKPNITAFKGLRPIFENRNSSGRWVYYAGQFRNYNQAAEALSTVKRSGFPNAIIAPFNNGSSVTIRNARLLEQQTKSNVTYQVKIEGYPQGLPQPIIEAIRMGTERDIAKKVIEGKDVFFIGPFTSKQEAESLIILLNSLSVNGVSLTEIF